MVTGKVDMDFPPERIKLIRALLGLNQDAFAEKYNLGRNTVSRLEAADAPRVMIGTTLGALLKAARDAGA